MKIIHKTTDITELVESTTWSGDDKQVARVINLSLIASAEDKNIPKITFKMGDAIYLRDDKGNEHFRGFIFKQDKNVSSNTMSVTAYDGLFYLQKSRGTYNFKNVTPGAITKKLCRDFGIVEGNIINGRPIKRIFDGESIYNIIMTAYTLESARTGKKYMPRMNKGRLDIIERGRKVAKYQLDPDTTITSANYGESMENSINRVKMYDEDNKYLGQVKLSGVPGILQDVYKKSKGENARQMAKSMLKGIERTAGVEALGDFECVTGNAVVIKEPHTGLNGLFYIINDSHTFSGGQHTMSLGLSFENVMDEQRGGETD